MTDSTTTPSKTPTKDHQRQTLTLAALRLNICTPSGVPSRVRRLPQQREEILSHQQVQRSEESHRSFLISKLTEAIELADQLLEDSCGYFDDD
jgi:hypothetical protein